MLFYVCVKGASIVNILLQKTDSSPNLNTPNMPHLHKNTKLPAYGSWGKKETKHEM
jgi:hypothetical protein